MTKALLISLFGSYVPVTYMDIDGIEVIPSGFSGVDWEYVLGVGLFAIVLYSVLRILEAVIRNV